MRVNQVTLEVTDLARSVAFYRILGLQQIVADRGYARFSCPQGACMLSLETVDAVPHWATTVFFECEDLDAIVPALEAAGVAFVHGPVDRPESRRSSRSSLGRPPGGRR